jgi:hypothetical protein
MKPFRSLASAILVAGLMAGQPAAFATDSPATPAPASDSNLATNPDSTADNPAVRDAIRAIERAPDPSSAIAAYAQGVAADRDGVSVEQAYVKRLTALGLPEIAEAQARDLVKRRPDDGVAWAVVAYLDARKGDTTGALQGILIASRQAPDDPFVQRTAGQLLAYYDYKVDHTRIDGTVSAGLEKVRNTLRDRADYAQAYRRATETYDQAPPAPPAAAAPRPPADLPPIDADPQRAAPPPGVYNNYTYNTYAADAPVYTDPFVYPYHDYPWWPSSWYWGTGLIVFDNGHSHHDDHHHDDHHHDSHHDSHNDWHHSGGSNDWHHSGGSGSGHDHAQFGSAAHFNSTGSNSGTRFATSGSRMGVQRSYASSSSSFRSAGAQRFSPRMSAMPSRGGFAQGSSFGRMGSAGGGGRMGGGGGGGRMGGGGGGGGHR